MTAGFLWGAPWRWGQGHRLVTALRRGFLVSAIAEVLMAEVFPVALGGRWNYLAETLSFGSQGSELQERAWEYPTKNFMATFQFSCWFEGCGTGVSSLGTQYVARFFNVPPPEGWVESGFGALILEMGILGPILWIIWVSALLWSGWRVIKRLRQTVYFPIGFAIWWYALVLLVLLTYFGLSPYQNFVNNAYLWLLIGILYRLPKLAQMPQPVPLPKHAHGTARWQLAAGGR